MKCSWGAVDICLDIFMREGNFIIALHNFVNPSQNSNASLWSLLSSYLAPVFNTEKKVCSDKQVSRTKDWRALLSVQRPFQSAIGILVFVRPSQANRVVFNCQSPSFIVKPFSLNGRPS